MYGAVAVRQAWWDEPVPPTGAEVHSGCGRAISINAQGTSRPLLLYQAVVNNQSTAEG